MHREADLVGCGSLTEECALPFCSRPPACGKQPLKLREGRAEQQHASDTSASRERRQCSRLVSTSGHLPRAVGAQGLAFSCWWPQVASCTATQIKILTDCKTGTLRQPATDMSCGGYMPGHSSCSPHHLQRRLEGVGVKASCEAKPPRSLKWCNLKEDDCLGPILPRPCLPLSGFSCHKGAVPSRSESKPHLDCSSPISRDLLPHIITKSMHNPAQ